MKKKSGILNFILIPKTFLKNERNESMLKNLSDCFFFQNIFSDINFRVGLKLMLIFLIFLILNLMEKFPFFKIYLKLIVNCLKIGFYI